SVIVYVEATSASDRPDCRLLFFFFSSRRRHTRFSRDWSSDVCSSDLLSRTEAFLTSYRSGVRTGDITPELSAWAAELLTGTRLRSEERRVGKERRSRGSPYHQRQRSPRGTRRR